MGFDWKSNSLINTPNISTYDWTTHVKKGEMEPHPDRHESKPFIFKTPVQNTYKARSFGKKKKYVMGGNGGGSSGHSSSNTSASGSGSSYSTGYSTPSDTSTSTYSKKISRKHKKRNKSKKKSTKHPNEDDLSNVIRGGQNKFHNLTPIA